MIMAINRWKPKATNVKQFNQSAGIDKTDTTYTRVRATISGTTVSGGTGATFEEAIDNFLVNVAAINHPYFDVIAWDVYIDPIDKASVTAESTTAGNPFTATLERWNGSAWVSLAWDAGETIDATGVNHYDDPINWSLGAIPVATDEIIFADTETSCCFGFSFDLFNDISIDASFTGALGLNPNGFSTTPDGKTVDYTVAEYRATYFTAKTDSTIKIGDGVGNGSGRINIHCPGCVPDIKILQTANQALDRNRAAINITGINTAGITCSIYDAPGGVDIISNSEPVELTQRATNPRTWSKVYSVTDAVIFGGWSEIDASTATTVTVYAGDVTVAGESIFATLTLRGGICHLNNEPTSGNTLTRLNIYGGKLDLTQRISDADIVAAHYYAQTGEYKIEAPYEGCYNPAGNTIEDAINWNFV
jgi:hypothetical protein